MDRASSNTPILITSKEVVVMNTTARHIIPNKAMTNLAASEEGVTEYSVADNDTSDYCTTAMLESEGVSF